MSREVHAQFYERLVGKFRRPTLPFNFTAAAQDRNAENLLTIDDEEVAKKYTENWYKRKEQSKPASIDVKVLWR
ncbi:MAG: hypothetical protein U0X86_000342 [Wolbachia endosymbiont of Xenopsylla cheopis]